MFVLPSREQLKQINVWRRIYSGSDGKIRRGGGGEENCGGGGRASLTDRTEVRNTDNTEPWPSLACIKTLGSLPHLTSASLCDVAAGGFSWRKFIKLSLDNFLPFSLLPFQLKKYSPQKFED